jgi:hypothetical protein
MALVGCADPAGPVTAPTTGSPGLLAEADASSAAERVALGKIGRLVATSLAEKSMRHQLKRDLRKAPFKEHKLELAQYLRSNDGKDLLAGMARGSSVDDVLTLVDEIRSLEFYMPVRKHRETWVGDGEVLVAVQLEEKDPIIAFDGSGRERNLDPDTPPEQATLSIVASETRFDQPMSVSATNVGDMNGRSIGTLEPRELEASALIAVDEDAGNGGGSSGGSSIPPGLYLEFSRILDVHEPFTRGEPEIEVHIQGPTSPNNPRYGVDLSCSGVGAYDYRKVFRQTGGFWEGRVMLFSAAEVADFNSKFSEGFHVLFWEDDDTPCVLKLESNTLIELLRSTAAATSTIAIKLVPKAPWYVVAGAFVAVFFENAGAWLKTNDDFVGAAVAQESAGYAYPGNTHVIMEGTRLNGRATIVYR